MVNQKDITFSTKNDTKIKFKKLFRIFMSLTEENKVISGGFSHKSNTITEIF